MRASIYARVSTDLQRDNFSIPSQIAECQRYAQKHGYAVVGDRYVDSGTGLDRDGGNGAVPAFVDDYSSRELSRPGLDAALSYLESVGFDVLIVHALDRLARDPYIRTTLEREITARGAKVEYVLGNYEDSPEGEVRKDLDATFGKWENAKRVERCNRGKRRKAESGKFVAGRPPFGYRIDGNSPTGLAINDDEAQIVEEIFSMYVEQDCSIRSIAQSLNMGKSSVRKILINTSYTGHSYYNKLKRNGNRLIERSHDEWIKFGTPPIIPPWLFAEAQRRLAENYLIKKRTPSRFYLLSGMVMCAHCDRVYSSQAARAGRHRRVNDAQYYRHRAKEGHCANRTLSARKLEPVVWEEIKAILLDPEQLVEGYRQSLEQQEENKARYIAHLETLQKTIIKLEQQRQNLTAVYIDPDVVLTKAEYIEQKSRIDDQIKAVQTDIDRVKAELQDLPTPIDLETLEGFASEVRDRLDGDYEPTPAEKREILELLHVKVYLTMDGSVKLDGWFSQSRDSLLTTSSARCNQNTVKFELVFTLL